MQQLNIITKEAHGKSPPLHRLCPGEQSIMSLVLIPLGERAARSRYIQGEIVYISKHKTINIMECEPLWIKYNSLFQSAVNSFKSRRDNISKQIFFYRLETVEII